MGAPALIKPPKGLNAIGVALAELEAGVLPIMIRRTLPDGTYQDIPLKKLVKKPEKAPEEL